MKLKDLGESFDTAVTDIDVDDQDFGSPKVPPRRSEDELGRGTFSRAIRDDDPHVIKKQQMTKYDSDNEMMDLFDEYAKIISDKKLWELVHFPRVYATKRKTDKRGNELHEWEMEKLISLDSISTEEIALLTRRYFAPKVAKEIREAQYHLGEFSYHVETITELNATGLLRDKTLAKAVTTLYNILKHLRYTSSGGVRVVMDLHDENIMFRRTQNGLQLVFSDPFVGIK